ncbi:MAG: hypothetical protein V3U85_01195 [Hyphomicrobium sp.]
MADRLRTRRGMDYPDAASLEVVRAAGGLQKMTPAARAELTMIRVEAGDWCDDLPEEARARYLARGDVEIVHTDDVAPGGSAAGWLGWGGK